jgi:hypothetical protein
MATTALAVGATTAMFSVAKGMQAERGRRTATEITPSR